MKKNSRRDFIKKGAMIAASGIVGSAFASSLIGSNNREMDEKAGFTLLPLPYAYNALEPHIDKLTMEIHHSRHHQAYVNNLNKALEEIVAMDNKYLEELCKNASKVSMVIRNNAGGHYNHTLFWILMKPNGGGQPSGVLADAIKSSFNSFEEFKSKFSDVAMKVFGSGWVWLVINKDKKLEITSTPNQDNPLMDLSDVKGEPILALDVWEHAYYLKHQNKRNNYINSWWNVVNWEEASNLYTVGIKK